MAGLDFVQGHYPIKTVKISLPALFFLNQIAQAIDMSPWDKNHYIYTYIYVIDVTTVKHGYYLFTC